jgi:DNA-binding XRE family transcriptional regulator
MTTKMKNFKLLQLQMLSEHIANISVCDRPSGGWIRGVRTAIGMNTRQLAERIGIARQATSKLELSELNDSISLRTLRKAAEGDGV